MKSFHDGRVVLHGGDCLEKLAELPDCSIDSVVTDPPYHLTSIVKRFGGASAAPAQEGTAGLYARASRGFMGKQWDGGDIAFRVELWAQVLRVLKPGGHMFAFSGTRTYHRMACAIEDAGFEIRDQFGWAYGSGFPKSHDVSKGIDKMLGFEREKVRVVAPKNPPNLVGGVDSDGDRPWRVKAMENGFHEAASDEAASDEAASDEAASDEAAGWQGWGTAVKPAWEPICLARKPLAEKSVAANVLKFGTGALNIDGCRVETNEDWGPRGEAKGLGGLNAFGWSLNKAGRSGLHSRGRFPANIVHDGSDEVLAVFPETGPANSGAKQTPKRGTVAFGDFAGRNVIVGYDDAGSSAARFFYSAKADAEDRLGSKHPTVKPVDLMRWLCRLVTPKGGLVLDPFAGTGTTGEAAFLKRVFRRC